MKIRIIQIKPTGWLKTLMEQEVKRHVVSDLDLLVPELFRDDLYAKDRIGKNTLPKDLGTLENDESWNAQFYWWNSETIANYYDGLMRYGYLLEDDNIQKKVKLFAEHILRSQDPDGYLGIYDRDTRYRFESENGELWAKTTIGRFLLGYYHYSGDQRALNAVIRMAREVMNHWELHLSTPFYGKNTFAGVAHGLMFVDVLFELYQLQNDRTYLDYALFLYEDYNQHDVSEPDCLIKNLLDPGYAFKGHGVHTYEHLRVVAIYDVFGGKNLDLYRHYMEKLSKVLSPSGGPIGDEWIMGNTADASQHGYEFCSIHELMTSLLLVSRLGLENQYAFAQRLFLNANLGCRHKEELTISYLKSDDSYAMTGDFHHHQPHALHKIQTRYKYSPTHQDAAVCCVPNSVRISPTYIENAVSCTGDRLIIHYGCPMEIILSVDDRPFMLSIEQKNPYVPVTVHTDLEDLLVMEMPEASAKIQIKTDPHGKIYFEHQNIVFAHPIDYESVHIKSYPFELFDTHVLPKRKHVLLKYVKDNDPVMSYHNGIPTIEVTLSQGESDVKVLLVPMGETILRQVTFPCED